MTTVNKVRWSTTRVKLKAASQKRKNIEKKENFKNLLGNPPEIIDNPIKKLSIANKTSNLYSLTKKNLTLYWKKKK